MNDVLRQVLRGVGFCLALFAGLLAVIAFSNGHTSDAAYIFVAALAGVFLMHFTQSPASNSVGSFPSASANTGDSDSSQRPPADFCTYCGAPKGPGPYCGACGRRLTSPESDAKPQKESKVTTERPIPPWIARHRPKTKAGALLLFGGLFGGFLAFQVLCDVIAEGALYGVFPGRLQSHGMFASKKNRQIDEVKIAPRDVAPQGMVSRRPDNLDQLCKDWVYYRRNPNPEAFARVNRWLSEYPENEVQKCLARNGA